MHTPTMTYRYQTRMFTKLTETKEKKTAQREMEKMQSPKEEMGRIHSKNRRPLRVFL